VAVWIGDNVSIAGLSPALELADLEFPPLDAEAILAANVYQRHVVLAPRRPVCPVDQLEAHVFHGDKQSHADDVETLTGALAALVAHVDATLVAAGVFLVIVWSTRYVSLGSIAATVALPGAAYLSGDSGPVVGTASGAAALILFRHRANLRRLRAGTERRLGRRAGPSAP